MSSVEGARYTCETCGAKGYSVVGGLCKTCWEEQVLKEEEVEELI